MKFDDDFYFYILLPTRYVQDCCFNLIKAFIETAYFRENGRQTLLVFHSLSF